MDAEMQALLDEADEFLADDDGEEVSMETEADGDDWVMCDDTPAVRAVDSAENSPASSVDSSDGGGSETGGADGDGSRVQLDLGADDLDAGSESEGDEDEDGRRERRLERVAKGSDCTAAMDIRVGLEESPKDADRFRHLVDVLGAESARAAFDATMRQEADGGMLSAQGKRRSPGGAFFEILKNFATEEQMRAINKFRKDKQREGARNKAIKEVAKAGGLRPQSRGATGQQRSSSSRAPSESSPRGGIKKKRERSPATGGGNSGGRGDSRGGRKKQQGQGRGAPNRQRGARSNDRRRHSIQRTPRPASAAVAAAHQQLQQDALMI
jgi:hypothetical protein